MNASRKAGSTGCATPGGSSTTIVRAWTGWCAKGCRQRIEAIFKAFGWDVVRLKHGALQRAAFAEDPVATSPPGPGSIQLPQPTLFRPDLPGRCGVALGAFMDELGDQGPCHRPAGPPLRRLSCQTLMSNLGGHCLETLAEAFEAVDHDRPIALHHLHHQGLGHAAGGPQGQPCRPDEPAGSDGCVPSVRWGLPPEQEWRRLCRGSRFDVERPRPVSWPTVPFYQTEGTSPRRSTTRPCRPPARSSSRTSALSTQAGFGKIMDASWRGMNSRRWPSASSPLRRTSPCRPIWAAG